MALPRDIPTLRAFGTGNFTRPDNVFCSQSLLPLYIRCHTDPSRMPVKTDHYPVIQELNLQRVTVERAPVPLYRAADWSEYREKLLTALLVLERRDSYDSVEAVEAAIAAVEKAVHETTQAVVEFSTPCAYTKRWYSKEMKELRAAYSRLERVAYDNRHVPEHPVHQQARAAAREYRRAVTAGKAQHWVKWLENLVDGQVWSVHKFLDATPSD
ncbi:hypothetical protein C8R45DRAFT_769220, partial [Mycena sanguinolenta]